MGSEGSSLFEPGGGVCEPVGEGDTEALSEAEGLATTLGLAEALPPAAHPGGCAVMLSASAVASTSYVTPCTLTVALVLRQVSVARMLGRPLFAAASASAAHCPGSPSARSVPGVGLKGEAPERMKTLSTGAAAAKLSQVTQTGVEVVGRGVGAGGAGAGGAAPEGDSRPEGHEAPSAALHEAAQERALLESKGRTTVTGAGGA